MSGYGQNQLAPTGYGYNVPQRAVPSPTPTQPTQTTQQTFQNPFQGTAGRGMGGRIAGMAQNFLRNPGMQPGGYDNRRFTIPEMGYPQDKFAALGPYNALAADMSMGRMGTTGFGPGGFSYNPYSATGGPIRGSWPGWGYGGLPGRYQQQPVYGAGQAFGTPGGYFGGSRFGYSGVDNPYGPGSYGAPGSMPFGGGSGMMGGGRMSPFTSFPGFGQHPSQVQPLQMIRPWLDYRSPYSAGSATMRRMRR